MVKDEFEIGGSQSGISFPFKSEKNVGFDLKNNNTSDLVGIDGSGRVEESGNSETE